MLVKRRIVLFMALFGPISAVSHSQSSEEKQILDLDSAWADGENRHDIAALNRILDDSCVVTTTSGRTETKQEYLKRFTGEVKAVMTQNLVDRKVRIYGDTAVLTETDNYTILSEGQTSTGSIRLTTTYLLRRHRWAAVAEQMTALKSKPEVAAVVPSIVGAWFVRMPEAPYPYHLFLFHADGTVIQSNPESGDPRSSDSNLMGVWTSDGDTVNAKLIETAADRTTHQFVSRTELVMSLNVQANVVRGTGTASTFDATGKLNGPTRSFAFEGDRIVR